MTYREKQQAAGVVCLVGTLAMVACLARMIPPGLAGNIGPVKWYFAGMMVSLAVSFPTGVLYYRYMSKVAGDQELQRMRAEMGALSHAAEKRPAKTQEKK
jgi:hypothetical protein